MGYYCDNDQLAVIPEVPGGSDIIRRSDSLIEKPPHIPSTTLNEEFLEISFIDIHSIICSFLFWLLKIWELNIQYLIFVTKND